MSNNSKPPTNIKSNLEQKPIKEVLYDLGVQLQNIRTFYENIIFKLLAEIEKTKKAEK